MNMSGQYVDAIPNRLKNDSNALFSLFEDINSSDNAIMITLITNPCFERTKLTNKAIPTIKI